MLDVLLGQPPDRPQSVMASNCTNGYELDATSIILWNAYSYPIRMYSNVPSFDIVWRTAWQNVLALERNKHIGMFPQLESMPKYAQKPFGAFQDRTRTYPKLKITRVHLNLFNHVERLGDGGRPWDTAIFVCLSLSIYI